MTGDAAMKFAAGMLDIPKQLDPKAFGGRRPDTPSHDCLRGIDLRRGMNEFLPYE